MVVLGQVFLRATAILEARRTCPAFHRETWGLSITKLNHAQAYLKMGRNLKTRLAIHKYT